jgi:acetyl esterase/lipase
MKTILKDISYGPDIKQILDIVLCEKKDVYAIVYLHGGAYLTGSKNQYPDFLLDYSKNNLFAAIDYRLINKNNDICMEDILNDVDEALKKIILIANEHNVNIKGFILVGHSAGGHIGLLYGYKSFLKNRVKIAACISLAGPTDFSDDIAWSSMTKWGENLKERLSFFSNMITRLTQHPIELRQCDWTNQNNYHEFKKQIMDISPLKYVSKLGRTPPTLLVHARSDDQVPFSNAIRLKSILDHASVPNKLIIPAGTGNNHLLGGEIYTSDGPMIFKNQRWVDEAQEWIEGTYYGSSI